MRCAPLRRAVLKPYSAVGLLAALTFCLLRPLAAEEAPPPVEVDFQARFTADSSLGPGAARISQSSNLVDFFAPVAGSSAFGLGVDLILERLDFHICNFDGFLPGRSSPLSAASMVTLQPTLVLMPSRSWSLIVSPMVQYAGANGADSHDSILMSGSLAATWQFAAEKKLGLGFDVSQRLGGSAAVFPFPVIDWHFSERWSLLSIDGESGRLSCVLTRAWSVFGQLEFLWRDLRLSRSSSIPSGILRYEAFPLSVGLQYKPNRHFTAAVMGGAALSQQYRFVDEHGEPLGTSGNHSPMIATFALNYAF